MRHIGEKAMKRIDFIMAGIVSAVWAILTCVYCALGGTIDAVNEIDIGGGWYIPLPSRYWDWLFIGFSYFTVSLLPRGHWLPKRKCKTEKDLDVLFMFLSMLLSGLVLMNLLKMTIEIKRLEPEHQSMVIFAACILAYSGKDKKDIAIPICAIGLINALFSGWSFAFLGILIVLNAKILIWLVINTFRSGFKTAWGRLWRCLVLGEGREATTNGD